MPRITSKLKIVSHSNPSIANISIAHLPFVQITRKAYEQKAEIIETANEMSREISKGTKDYADGILANLETAINNVSVTLNEAIKTIEQNRKELK